MAETAQVQFLMCNILMSPSPILIVMSTFKSFFLAALALNCIPSCGPNALCQKNDGLPKCVCSFGYQGDGYNCTGSREWQSLAFLLLLTLPFNDQPDKHISPLSQNAQ